MVHKLLCFNNAAINTIADFVSTWHFVVDLIMQLECWIQQQEKSEIRVWG